MSPAPARVDELKKRYEENPRRFFAPLANEYRKAGDLDAAIDLCRMHLDEQPGHLSGHIVYGQALFESGRVGDAKVAFEAALNLDPENLIALRHLGDIGKAEGDVAVAAQWYQRVLEADPRNEEVIALIADLQQPPVAPSVVVSLEEPPPPPAPQYAVEAPMSVDLPFIDPSAPTPFVAMEAVPAAKPLAVPPSEPASEPAPEPARVPSQLRPRPSIGLMDLDLDLGEESSTPADLLGAEPAAASAPPAADDALPVFAEHLPPADTTFPDSGVAGPELSVADASVGIPPAEAPPLEALDAEFNIERPADEAPTFAAVKDEPVFGSALDVTTTPAVESIPATPATPADFDALFGNAPIADVFVGGDDAPVVTGDPGFIADAFVGRELVDAPPDASIDAGTTPPPFVTETMAELYLQQGFHQEALEVYRQLSALDPGDASLTERVRHLEHGSRSSMAIDRVSQEIEAAAEAEELRHSAEIPAVSEDAVPSEPEPAAEPDVIRELADAVPAVPVDASAPAAAPAALPAPTGPTAREIFARIAYRRASPGERVAREIVETVQETATISAVAPDRSLAPAAVDIPGAAPAVAAPGGSIDQLFGAGTVTSDDEGAAMTVAAAFDAAPAATVKGQPTYAGTDEISLESVFRDEGGTARPAPAVDRQSTKLRFDQFFSSGAGDSTSSSTPPPAAPGRGEEDIAQFSDWLKGLKGS